MVTRVSVLGVAAAAVLLAMADGAAATGATAFAAGPMDSLSTPVGLTAIGLGVVGMVAGAFRKKKIQPENQRKG
ncbi:hypothetical protein [Saccharopolyspora phatthalungensis]|uniref:Putative phage tail protein n=1 Tax=Saccharopolyspora phatthalungensis TaxID=664693 RepID=A0A840Q5N8_9PSEU|nr:hypothetical protein [Saccharopolyspora phatthalungensis]MBB5155011.1 putative phage tail protein [Saccharopolyspora phatthalungensis]